MKKIFFLFLLSSTLCASEETCQNKIEIALYLSQIINHKPLSKKRFRYLKKKLSEDPQLLNVNIFGYTLADRIENRIKNGIIDSEILVFYTELTKPLIAIESYSDF